MRLLPWVKAPLLLFKRPGVAVALLTATVVAVLPAAGTPLLISASQSDSIEQQLNEQCALPGGFYSTFERSGYVESDGGGEGAMQTSTTIDAVDREDVLSEIERIEQLAAQIDGVAGVDRTLALGSPQPWSDHYGRVVGVRNGDGGYNSVFFMYRDDVVDKIETLEGDSGPGAWLPTEFSGVGHLGPGDLLVTGLVSKVDGEPQPWELVSGVPTDYTSGSEPADLELPVAGVYESLNGHPLGKAHWCHLEYGLNMNVTPEPQWRPTILVDEESFWALAEQAELNIQVHLRFELDDTLSLSDAAAVADHLAAIEPEVTTTGTTMEYELDRFVHRADLVGDALQIPIGVVSGAAILVGLCIVGAGAVLWVRRRNVELKALAGRGVPPAALGFKGALEALPAIVVGGIAGYLACRATMPWWAPAELVDSAALVWSAVLAVATASLALLVVGVVSGRGTRRFTEPATTVRRHLGRLPWEVLPMGGAAAAWLWLDDSIVITSGEAADRVGQVAQLPGRVFVVPLLAALACAVMAARLMHRQWRWPNRFTRSVSGFIAAGRIRRDRFSSAVMVAAVAVPTALAGYAITASASVGATIDAQARSEIGSDVVVSFEEPADIGEALSRFGAATPVVRVDTLSMDRIRVNTLFVDPDTFAEAADTASMMAGVDLAAALTDESGDGVPAVAIGAGEISNGPATVNLPGPSTMNVDVTTVPDLPGKRAGNPVVLVSAQHMPELSWTNGYQWWIRTDDPAAARAFAQSEYEDADVIVAAERYDGTPKQSLTASIEYLLWVSVLTAVVVVVGVLLRLESRSGANRRAFVIMRRMGLRPGPHRLALLREIGSLLTIGVVHGAVIATVLVAAMAGDFDVDPVGGPGVVVTVPGAAVAWLVTATLVTIGFAGLFTHARVAAAKPSLVLRDTG